MIFYEDSLPDGDFYEEMDLDKVDLDKVDLDKTE